MAGAKEIRSKIKSIKNTQKITKAMEMVAASKMRKAQDRMAASRPYAEKINTVLSHLAQAHPEYKHPYLFERETVKRVGYIIVSTDRGLVRWPEQQHVQGNREQDDRMGQAGCRS